MASDSTHYHQQLMRSVDFSLFVQECTKATSCSSLSDMFFLIEIDVGHYF